MLLRLWRQRFWRFTPTRAAVLLAAAISVVMVSSGVLRRLDERLSDAWFSLTSVAPSGRTVLVLIDQAAAQRGSGVRLPRGVLGQLLRQLEAAGASRILIELGLADRSSDLEDELLEGVLTDIGAKIAVSLNAIVSGSADQARWRRTGILEKFARHVSLTASDFVLDRDAQLRENGIRDQQLPALVGSPFWLSGAAEPTHVFRIDFGINLQQIPTMDAELLLGGTAATGQLQHANVIVGSLSSPTGYGIRVPRYGALARPQITALAAETLLLGREVRIPPSLIANCAVVLLAAVIALWCARLSPVAGAGLAVGVVLCSIGLSAKLQATMAVVGPAASLAGAAVIGFASAQISVHPAFAMLRDAARALWSGVDLRLAWVLNDASDGLLTFDSSGSVLSVNLAARRLLGIHGFGKGRAARLYELIGPRAECVLAAICEQTPRRVQVTVRRGEAEHFLELAVNAVPVQDGWMGVAVVRDVTEQHLEFATLNRFASEDPLTGLLNRRGFERALHTITGNDASERALLMCDLDGFKTINDTFGHQAGDVVLREVAGRLVRVTGHAGLVARLGGDEFVVLLKESEPAAGEIAKRLIEAVTKPITIGPRQAQVGMSIGIALSSSHQSPAAIMASADRAMYRAKAAHSGYTFAREQRAA